MGGMQQAGSLFSVPFRSPEAQRHRLPAPRAHVGHSSIRRATRTCPRGSFDSSGALPVGAPLSPARRRREQRDTVPRRPGTAARPGGPTPTIDRQQQRHRQLAAQPTSFGPLQSNPDPGISDVCTSVLRLVSRRIGTSNRRRPSTRCSRPGRRPAAVPFRRTPYGQLATYPPIQGSVLLRRRGHPVGTANLAALR